MLELTVLNSSYLYYPNKCNLNVWLLFKICPPNNLKYYLASSHTPYSSKKELTLKLVSFTTTVIVHTRSLFGVMAAVFKNSFSNCQNISYDILWSSPYKFYRFICPRTYTTFYDVHNQDPDKRYNFVLNTASFLVFLGDFGCDVIRPACRKNLVSANWPGDEVVINRVAFTQVPKKRKNQDIMLVWSVVKD